MDNRRSVNIKKPIFIIGCPRSGTGILHQLLRLHPSLAWVTPATNIFYPHLKIAKLIDDLSIALRNKGLDFLIPNSVRGPFDGSLRHPTLPETNEGHRIWKKLKMLLKKDNDYFDKKDVNKLTKKIFTHM